MRRTGSLLLALLALPSPARAEQGGPPPPPEAEAADVLPASVLDVAHAEGAPGLAAGGRLAAGDRVSLPAGACLRLVAGDRAALTLCGPARATVEAAPAGLVLDVAAGRGVLRAGPGGAGLRASGRLVSVRTGAVAFEAGPPARAFALEGEPTIDGAATEPAPAEVAAELGAATLCAPPRPRIAIRLGDPAGLAAAADRARASDAEAGSEPTSAEGGATCVDSADGSSATDPGQGGEGGLDPDARRDRGRVRVVVEVPWRSP